MILPKDGIKLHRGNLGAITQHLKFAALRYGQDETELRTPPLHLTHEVVHIAGIKIGGVAELAFYRFLPGSEVGVFNVFVPEKGFFEVALYPFLGGVSAAGSDQVCADLLVPNVAKAILRKAAFLTPRLELKPEALPGIQQWLNLLADGREVTAMELDAVFGDNHTASFPETAECRKSQVHFCICDR